MADYLFKFGNYIFPMKWIAEKGYDSAPNQRQDLDPYTDQFGVTHRNALKHTKTAVTIKTVELPWNVYDEIFNGITSNYINYDERDATCEYYDLENRTMKTGHLYLESSFKGTVKIFGHSYEPLTLTFTEY